MEALNYRITFFITNKTFIKGKDKWTRKEDEKQYVEGRQRLQSSGHFISEFLMHKQETKQITPNGSWIGMKPEKNKQN